MKDQEATAKLESTYRMQTRMMSGQLRPTGVPPDELEVSNEAILVALGRIAEIARLPTIKAWFSGLGRRLSTAYRGTASAE